MVCLPAGSTTRRRGRTRRVLAGFDRLCCTSLGLERRTGFGNSLAATGAGTGGGRDAGRVTGTKRNVINGSRSTTSGPRLPTRTTMWVNNDKTISNSSRLRRGGAGSGSQAAYSFRSI